MVGKPFKKGQSGNPGGRPKEAADVKALAREHGKDAIAKLVTLMDSKDERTIIAACKELLDRGYGKAPQAITGEGGEGPVEVIVSDLEFARRMAFMLAKGVKQDESV